jgi:hypothetical protein
MPLESTSTLPTPLAVPTVIGAPSEGVVVAAGLLVVSSPPP